MGESLNLQKLSEDLKNAGNPWQMNPNTTMAQLTEDERLRRLGFQPGPGDISIEEAVRLDIAAPSITIEQMAAESAGLPAKFDNRDINGKNYTTPVKNQGGCGSCVAFGTVAVLETRYKRLYNVPSFPIDLSEAQMFYCHAKEDGRTCATGWWPDKALEKAKSKGVTFEEYFPYTAGDQSCALHSGWQDYLATCTSYSKISGRAQIKDWLANKGSVTGCFIVYQDFFSYSSGVYRHVSGSEAGGHCVEIIGYDDTLGCWICKNSWGPGWGDNGYFKIAYGQCQIETWSGPYGVTGIGLRMWNNNVRVNGLWSNSSERNAWVHFQGVGWRKITNDSALAQYTMLSQLAVAKSAGRNVRALQDNNVIEQIYVV